MALRRGANRRTSIPLWWASLLIAVLLWTPLPAQALEAGAAKLPITPPLGTPLNGYYARLGQGAEQVHDPVWVRCLYLADDDTKLFLVNADLCIINRELRERVLELAPREVPRENIILTATHNHSAQGAMCRNLLWRSITGRYMPEVLEQTAGAFAQVMHEALQNSTRAAIGYGTATQDNLTTNRRFPNGPRDSQIGVLRVEDSDGNAIVIAANIAAHPTTVDGDDFMSISADYPGYYYTALEALSNPGCVAMFFNGAEGDQRPGNPERKADGWDLTESIGRLLATRVKQLANTITCTEQPISLARKNAVLPLTMADSFLPTTTILQTLEIGDLLMTFIPGEPCVDIGLELRRRALARGYASQFTVGLANDHAMYFVPRELYGQRIYESGMNFYGPGIEDWFYREFDELMTRGEPAAVPAPPGEPALEERKSVLYMRIAGSPYEMGFQQGAALGETLRANYAREVVARCESGEWVPDSGLWPLGAGFINKTPLALLRLGIGARPLLAGLSTETLSMLEGMADGAQLPFDALWLVQCLPTYAATATEETGYPLEQMYLTPFCTMFAAVGDRAGAEELLVGRNLDWPAAEAPLVVEVRPDTGHRYLQIGFFWNLGVFTGMNDAGVVACVERVEAFGQPTLDGPPVEVVLSEVLREADTLNEAIALMESAKHVRGYSVLLAGADAAGAAIIEYNGKVQVRRPTNGIILGVTPEARKEQDEETDAALPVLTVDELRYQRVLDLLNEERIIGPEEIEAVLMDRQAGRTGKDQIRNAWTRHSVVFEPRELRLRVAVQGEDGEMSEFETFSLSEAGK